MLLSKKEIETLLSGRIESGPLAETEAGNIVAWAERVRVEAATLGLVLAGRLKIARAVSDSDLSFVESEGVSVSKPKRGSHAKDVIG